MIQNFSELIELVKSEGQKTISVAFAEDKDVLSALEKARVMGLTNAILTGNPDNIEKMCHSLQIDASAYEIVSADNEKHAIQQAVGYISELHAYIVPFYIEVKVSALVSLRNEERIIIREQASILYISIVALPI